MFLVWFLQQSHVIQADLELSKAETIIELLILPLPSQFGDSGICVLPHHTHGERNLGLMTLSYKPALRFFSKKGLC